MVIVTSEYSNPFGLIVIVTTYCCLPVHSGQ